MRLFAVTLVLSAIAGCGSPEEREPLALSAAPTPPRNGASTGACALPTEGCPCVPGPSGVECRVYRRSGDYVSCSVGITTCLATDAGTFAYGPCEGAATIWDGGVD
jgi:hypothetical protein